MIVRKFTEEYSPLNIMLEKNIDDIAIYIQSKYPEWVVEDMYGFKAGIQKLVDEFIPHPYKVPVKNDTEDRRIPGYHH